MYEWNRFEHDNYIFIAYLPDSAGDELAFTISIAKDGSEVRGKTVPLLYRSIFGPDVGDVASLNERVEEIMRELGWRRWP